MKDGLTSDELRALAQTAMQSPRTPLERLTPQVCDLAGLPVPSFHTHDRIRHAGLIAQNDGWHVTDAGWRALDAATP